MKKTVKILVASLVLLQVALFANVPTEQELKDTFLVLKQHNIGIDEIVEHESLYLGKGSVGTQQGTRPVDFFVTKDKGAIIFGQAFDGNGERLTIPVDMSKIEKDAAFKIGSGKKKYYIFTDPECPYCHKMKKALKGKEKLGTFYFYLYPLSFHKNAMDMSLYIISEEQKKKGAGWQAALGIAEGKNSYADGVKKIKQKDSDRYKLIIKTNMTHGEKLGLSGTPSMYDENGNSINWIELLK